MKLVVFTYDGTELPCDIISSMTNQMTRFVKSGSSITVKKLNEEDLVKLGIKSAVCLAPSRNEALEQAAIYMQKRFGTFFKNPVSLVVSMSEIKGSTTEEARILKSAVSIIVENLGNPMLKQYDITPSVAKVIKEFSTCYHV
jgi:hypothetical protein